jgi:hypothetical protein
MKGESLIMELTNRQVEHVAHSVAIRFGITGLVSAHRPANRDNLLVIQVLGNPSYEFEMESDATQDDVCRKTEEILGAAKKAG